MRKIFASHTFPSLNRFISNNEGYGWNSEQRYEEEYGESAELRRGLDVLELVPSPHLTENELAAARTVEFEQFNAQMQPKITWPASYAKARALLDQLERSEGLAEMRIEEARRVNAVARAARPAAASCRAGAAGRPS